MIFDSNTKHLRHALFVACLIVFIFNSLFLFADNYKEGNKRVTILFTNDIHSNANARTLPYEAKIVRDNDTLHIVGGYGRLATLIERERAKAEKEGSSVIVVDAGDNSVGTIFHSLYQDEAFDIRTLARMQYDACTFGNHDFDYGTDGVANMLISAVEKENINGRHKLPAIVIANVTPSNDGLLTKAYNTANVSNSILLNKNGVKIGIIGLLGEHAYSVIGNKDNKIEFTSPIDAAAIEVEKLKESGADYIVAISHGGTLYGDGKLLDSTFIKGHKNKKYPARKGEGRVAMSMDDSELIYANSKLREKSQDGKLATGVPGIDVIISGHDHEFLYAPFIINNTIIGSSGGYNCMLGKIVMEKDSLVSYELIPITSDILPSESIEKWIDTMAQKISTSFYNTMGVLPFDTVGVISREYNTSLDSDGNMDLGHLIAKSYKKIALKYVDGINEKDLIAVTPAGVIRNNLAKGYITYNEIFNVLSLGTNSIGDTGYPLVLLWLTGSEIKDICELVATISPSMEDARLFFDGLTFKYNKYKIPFTKVTDVLVAGVSINNRQLYPLVTGIYTAQMIGLLKSESYGILSAMPKNKEGEIVEDINKHIIKNGSREVVEWMAFAEFIGEEGRADMDISINKSAINESTKQVYYIYLSWTFLFIGSIIIAVSLFKKRSKKQRL